MIKKLNYIVLSIFLVTLLAGCGHKEAQEAQEKLVSFVKEAQIHADQYSAEEWNTSLAQYTELAKSLQQEWDNLTPEQQHEANQYAKVYNNLRQAHDPSLAQPMMEEITEGEDLTDQFI